MSNMTVREYIRHVFPNFDTEFSACNNFGLNCSTCKFHRNKESNASYRCDDELENAPIEDFIPDWKERLNIDEAEWIEDGYLDKPIVCSHCGAESESETNYCSYCGKKMKKGWWNDEIN